MAYYNPKFKVQLTGVVMNITAYGIPVGMHLGNWYVADTAVNGETQTLLVRFNLNNDLNKTQKSMEQTCAYYIKGILEFVQKAEEKHNMMLGAEKYAQEMIRTIGCEVE